MREIIRRERLNELAFEGSRFWDLKRWKLAKEYMNKPVRGLNILGETTEDFYKERTIYQLHYSDKDYLWPIRQGVLQTNQNLIQNMDWRSEEHTSELQSLMRNSYDVFCLKKKKNKKI